MRILLMWFSVLLLLSGCESSNTPVDRYTGSFEEAGWSGEFIFDEPDDGREGTLRLTYKGSKVLGEEIEYQLRSGDSTFAGSMEVTGNTAEKHFRFGESLHTHQYLEVTVLLHGGGSMWTLRPPE